MTDETEKEITSPEVNKEIPVNQVPVDSAIPNTENPWMYDYTNRIVRLKPSVNTYTVDSGSLSSDVVTLTGTQVLTNKTLTTPTIGDLTNMAHDHEDAAGGGQLDEDALALTDVVTNNASTSQHGFAKKGSGSSTDYYGGDNDYHALPSSTATWKCGSTSKDASDASTTQTIAHGLGGTPSFVRLLAMAVIGINTHVQADIVYNGTTNAGISYYGDGAGGTFVVGGGFILNVNIGGGVINTQTGVLSIDATNITITWTKTGNPTGTYTITWMATK